MLAYAERAMQMVNGRVQIPKTATNILGIPPPGEPAWAARPTDGAGGAGRTASGLVQKAIDPRQEAACGPPLSDQALQVSRC